MSSFTAINHPVDGRRSQGTTQPLSPLPHPSRSKGTRAESQLLTPPKTSKKLGRKSKKGDQGTLQPGGVTKNRRSFTKTKSAPAQGLHHDVGRSEQDLLLGSHAAQISAQTLRKLSAFKHKPEDTLEGMDQGPISANLRPQSLKGNRSVGGVTEACYNTPASIDQLEHGKLDIEPHNHEDHESQDRNTKQASDFESVSPRFHHSIPCAEESLGYSDSLVYQPEAQSWADRFTANHGANDTQLDETLYAQFINHDMIEENSPTTDYQGYSTLMADNTNKGILSRQKSDDTLLAEERIDTNVPRNRFPVDQPARSLYHDSAVIPSGEPSFTLEECASRTHFIDRNHDLHSHYQNPSPSYTVHSIQTDGGTSRLNAPTTIDAFRSFPSRLPAHLGKHASPQLTIYSNDEVSDFDLKHEDFLDENVDEVADLLTISDQASIDHESTNPPSTFIRPPSPKLKWNPPRQYNSKDKRLSSPVPATRSSYVGIPAKGISNIYPQPDLELQRKQTITPPHKSSTTKHQPNANQRQDALSSLQTTLKEDYPHSSPALSLPTPFIRSPFPPPLRDRSPIPGLSPKSRLRTCFRLGEALNAASQASKNHTMAIVELYALVLHSNRRRDTQTFTFADLFRPDRPPFLDGSWTGWKGSAYWELDARAFMNKKEGGRMCRVVARMERQGQGKWGLAILSLWEADMEDVEAVKPVFCS